MASSDFELRLAPEAVRQWLGIEDRVSREEVHEILEELRRTGTTGRTFSLLNRPEHRAYGKSVKVLFHRDEERRLLSITHVLLRRG